MKNGVMNNKIKIILIDEIKKLNVLINVFFWNIKKLVIDNEFIEKKSFFY